MCSLMLFYKVQIRKVFHYIILSPSFFVYFLRSLSIFVKPEPDVTVAFVKYHILICTQVLQTPDFRNSEAADEIRQRELFKTHITSHVLAVLHKHDRLK